MFAALQGGVVLAGTAISFQLWGNAIIGSLRFEHVRNRVLVEFFTGKAVLGKQHISTPSMKTASMGTFVRPPVCISCRAVYTKRPMRGRLRYNCPLDSALGGTSSGCFVFYKKY